MSQKCPAVFERMQYYILLDDSRCVNCPGSIIAVFDILEPFSEFRTGSGRGGRGCFLDGAAGVYQVAFFTDGNRLIAEFRIRLL